LRVKLDRMTGKSGTVRLDVRNRLVEVAEELFAQAGIDSVSLREINAAAGATNASAIQYHFGDRAGLIRAVLARHDPSVESGRHVLLDQYEADEREGDLRSLAGALVRPLAAVLDLAPGYLQIRADLLNRPRPVIEPASLHDPSDSTNRWRVLVQPLLSPEAVRLHRRFHALRFTLTELAQRTRSAPRRDDRLFVSNLIDMTTALLSAPISSETNQQLKQAHRGTRAAENA
jgi:AcrR family transcriptional regulator